MYTFGIPFRVRIVNEVMKTVILRILNPFVDILSFVNLRLYVSPFALMLKITKSYWFSKHQQAILIRFSSFEDHKCVRGDAKCYPHCLSFLCRGL